ncbi:MAG: hypothetical protein WDO70_12420 [Alphaproteobacteria bacterium]
MGPLALQGGDLRREIAEQDGVGVPSSRLSAAVPILMTRFMARYWP